MAPLTILFLYTAVASGGAAVFGVYYHANASNVVKEDIPGGIDADSAVYDIQTETGICFEFVAASSGISHVHTPCTEYVLDHLKDPSKLVNMTVEPVRDLDAPQPAG